MLSKSGQEIKRELMSDIVIIARMDRYNHELGGDDTDDTDDSPLFGSFSSYSPQYRKQQYSRLASNTSNVTCTSSDDNASNTSTSTQDICKMLTTPELRKFNVSLRLLGYIALLNVLTCICLFSFSR